MNERMNPRVKAAWVAALRSGEYKQAVGQLKAGDGHCCLGVLCDLYAKEHAIANWTTSELGANDGEDEEPGVEVVHWAGLPCANPKVEIEATVAPVSEFNDGWVKNKKVGGRTFAEIADAIEAQL